MKKQIQYFLIIILFNSLACRAGDNQGQRQLKSILKTSDLYKQQKEEDERKKLALQKLINLFNQHKEAKQYLEKTRQTLSSNAILYSMCALYVHRETKKRRQLQQPQRRPGIIMATSVRKILNFFKGNAGNRK